MFTEELSPTTLQVGDVILWDPAAYSIVFARTHTNKTTERLKPSRTDNKILAEYIHSKDDFQSIARLIACVCHCAIKKYSDEGDSWLLVKIETTI